MTNTIKHFDNFAQQIKKTTESFNRLKTLIDEAKNQIQKERIDFVAKLLESKQQKGECNYTTTYLSTTKTQKITTKQQKFYFS